ncbi:hypothetical protein RhiirA4_445092 [Rhizophagus irregularis]|uniref:Uncharacterized protein n=1 Tax=Rhizophagus irregularis TaxID=588596 RepID=A0A2I1GMM0_9GLOM|nr:hypothetical protein RhiirA4_445092 [Rhizophagus irregularis]
MFSRKFTYRNDINECPMFLSVNQAILIPSPNEWNKDSIPISHPYITASVYLNSNPSQKFNNRSIIKSQCNNVFCSFNKSKYNHDFYLYYDEDSSRWSKTIPSIKNGNTKVYIAGLYMGHYPKVEKNNQFYYAIQLTELDFELKSNKLNYNIDEYEDDDELYFGTPSSKLKGSDKRKYDVSSEPSELSSSSSSSTSHNKKSKKKSVKKIKTITPTIEIDDQPVRIKHELSYDKLFTKKAGESNDKHPAIHPPYPYYNPKLPPPPLHDNPYYPYYSYYPPYDINKNPHNPLYSQASSSTSNFNDNINRNKKSDLSQQTNSDELFNKDKKSVQFDLPDDDLQQSETVKRGTKSTRGKQTSKRGSRSSKNSNPPTRKSPRKKGGILNIAVEKIIEIPSDEDNIDNTQTDESRMDTESDYNTQNEELLNNDDDSNNLSD